jgi:hypothetical protein
MRLSRLLEAVKTPEALKKRYQGWYVQLRRSGDFVRIDIINPKRASDSLGHALLNKADDGFWSVANIEAVAAPDAESRYLSNKWGPMIYDIIVEYSTMNGKGLIPAEAATYLTKHYITYANKEFSRKGSPIGEKQLNFTSPHAKKHYARMYRTGKGLDGQPIEVESLEDLVVIKPSYHPEYKKGTEFEDIPWNWKELPEWRQKVQDAGGVMTSSWPLFREHSIRFFQDAFENTPELYSSYRKAPHIITKLDNYGLLK